MLIANLWDWVLIAMTETFALVRCYDGFDIALIGLVAEEEIAYRIIGFGYGETEGALVFEPWALDAKVPTTLLRRRRATPDDERRLWQLVASGKYEFVDTTRFRRLLGRGLIDADGYATSQGESTFGTGP